MIKQTEKSISDSSEYSSSRLEAFSDGVFAIAITLLVLNIQLPENASNITIDKALLLSIPKLEVWIISFFIIGNMWMRHHKLINQLTRIDALFIKLNLFYLMFVTVIPWLVSLIVVYDNQPMAITVFSGSIALLTLINLFIWIYVSNIKKIISDKVTNYQKKLTLINIIIVILVALLSILVAYKVAVRLALYCYFLTPLFDHIVKLIFKNKDETKSN